MAEEKTSTGFHALVFGASGLAGWAVVNQLLENYPEPNIFSKVTALVNRPLNVAESFWPTSPSRPELHLVSHVNLLEGTVEEVAKLLKNKVADIANVTHMFYFAYKQEDDEDFEVKVNREMLERAIGALDHLAPMLKFVVFPTGTRAYGVYSPGGVFSAPYDESMILPASERSKIFYFALRDLLEKRSKCKGWSWCEVRPDAIIGFAPNGSIFNLTAYWATYLSLYALVEGKGAQVPFPGTPDGYNCLYNGVSADMIAKLSIWAALHPDEAGEEVFNIADQATPSSMRQIWPAVAGYFDLEGVAPTQNPEGLKPGEYIKLHQQLLDKDGLKVSRVFKSEHMEWCGTRLNFDRQLNLQKVKSVGFTVETNPTLSWFKAFDKMKEAGMIPQ